MHGKDEHAVKVLYISKVRASWSWT